MAQIIPLPKLPSAKETEEVVLSNVFHIHDFPKDIVSDCGPQFISQFWKAFCALLGATVSLSSGYHLEFFVSSQVFVFVLILSCLIDFPFFFFFFKLS